MDPTSIPIILGAIGALFGAYATFQQQRAANMNKRFEMLFGFQGKSLDDLRKEAEDFRVRIAAAEKNVLDCERAKHEQGMRIIDLERTVAELKRLIANAPAAE